VSRLCNIPSLYTFLADDDINGMELVVCRLRGGIGRGISSEC